MPEDRKPRRQRSAWDDAKRATWGSRDREQTEPGVMPIGPAPVEIDPEVTPRPIDMNEILTVAWELRKLPDEVAGIKAAVVGYTRQVDRHEGELDQWVGKLKDCIADIDQLAIRQTEIGANLDAFFERDWERIGKGLESVTAALGGVRSEMAELKASVSSVVSRQDQQQAMYHALDARLTSLERDKAVAAGASSERVRIFKLAHAGVAAVFAFAGWLAAHFHLFG